MTYRILNQAPQYLLPDGSVNAGGSLTFFEPDLSTPKNTWSDPDMVTLNANPVLLDSAGRTVTDVWGNGEYGVVMKDADGVTIWTRSPVSNGAAAGASIPALVNGQFLSNDGSNLVWQPILQVPDPTGLANYVLTSDGTGVPVWQQQEEPPDPPDPDIVVGLNKFQAGLSDNITKQLVQWGAATAPSAASSPSTSVAVTFPTAFKEAPVVVPSINQSQVCSAGLVGQVAAYGITATGCTLKVHSGDNDNQSEFFINASVALSYIAIGRVDVAE